MKRYYIKFEFKGVWGYYLNELKPVNDFHCARSYSARRSAKRAFDSSCFAGCRYIIEAHGEKDRKSKEKISLAEHT